MKVGELIKILSKFDQEQIVVVDGYEEGADDINNVKETEVILNNNLGTWYIGKHECVCDYDKKKGDYDNKKITKVILLNWVRQ